MVGSLSQELLVIADYFFTVFHTLLIVFNLFGWVWKPLRKWHLACILLTFGSWGILGIWYGLGYCPLTDWHWQVLYQRGHTNLPNSYVAYLIWRTAGITLTPNIVDGITVGAALGALICSLWVNFGKR